MLAGAKHIQSWLKKRIGDTMSKSDKLKFLISLGLVLKYSVEGADFTVREMLFYIAKTPMI